jgi:glutamate/aspartate transport system substrate-binding protein
MRSTSLLLAACLGALSIVSAHAQALDGTLKKIKDTGAITIAYRETSVPFSFLDDNQKPAGFAVDICLKIVDAVKATLKLDKLDIRYVPVTSATRIPLIANGTVDLECGSTTNNAERAKQVSFTNSHFLTASRYVSKKVNHIDKIDDMKGKSIASVAGTTNIKQLLEANTQRGLGINVIAAKDNPEAFLMVQTDRASAFVMDDILLAGLIANAKNGGAFVISDDAFSKPEPYGIMLRHGDTAFKAVADKATAELYTSPAMRALYDKWFMRPINAVGLNLNYPMPAVMKKAFAHPSDSSDPASYVN